MNEIGEAIIKSGQLVSATLIATRGRWFWRRYLVSFNTRHRAHGGWGALGYRVPPQTEDYLTKDTEWVKVFIPTAKESSHEPQQVR